jgi:hypothetical protein
MTRSARSRSSVVTCAGGRVTASAARTPSAINALVASAGVEPTLLTPRSTHRIDELMGINPPFYLVKNPPQFPLKPVLTHAESGGVVGTDGECAASRKPLRRSEIVGFFGKRCGV